MLYLSFCNQVYVAPEAENLKVYSCGIMWTENLYWHVSICIIHTGAYSNFNIVIINFDTADIYWVVDYSSIYETLYLSYRLNQCSQLGMKKLCLSKCTPL